MIERREIRSREEWLEWRRRVVTASQAGALPAFNCHPYLTPLKLWAEMRGVEFDNADNKILRRGRWLEPSIPNILRDIVPAGWTLEAPGKFYVDEELGCGATPDFLVHGDERGLGVCQSKTVAPSVWKREWADGKEIPFWIVLQTLMEMMLTDAKWGCVCALLVDAYNMDAVVLEVPRHPAAEEKLLREIKRFVADVREGIEPPIDFERDGATLKLLLPKEVPGSSINLTGNNEVPDMLINRADLLDDIKEMEARCTVIENRLRAIIGENERAIGIDGWTISFKVEPRKEYMVKASAPRVLRIKDHREDNK